MNKQQLVFRNHRYRKVSWIRARKKWLQIIRDNRTKNVLHIYSHAANFMFRFQLDYIAFYASWSHRDRRYTMTDDYDFKQLVIDSKIRGDYWYPCLIDNIHVIYRIEKSNHCI